ncbi:MAG: hypothetical protein HRT90_01320 [Candidatus Margulisbacteria bacterium]|nr:hypothetical protein [Candidatus Margulisiibacteriota bacterium]
MMYDAILSLCRKSFYIVSYEKLTNAVSETLLERFSAKHPFLKPELIMVKGKPFGFRGIKKAIQRLEKYPIFIEIESYTDEDKERYIEQFDCYAEVAFTKIDKLPDVIELSESYKPYISLERVTQVLNSSHQVLSVYTTLSENLLNIEAELEDHHLRNKEEINRRVIPYFSAFVQFIKSLDEILNENKNAQTVKPLDLVGLFGQEGADTPS